MKSWFALTAAGAQQATPLKLSITRLSMQPLNNETTLNMNEDGFCPRLQLLL